MNRIHRLDPVVANQIAAGEVVERPASVVKELIENSLDAGAARIMVWVKGGGHTEVGVQDDGHGMGPSDLKLSVARHATSKLTRLSDLDRGQWLGFRGEALAAISAVAEVAISSREEGAAHGYRLVVRYGDSEPLAPEAMAPGTRVVVRDLFSRLPGRLKALKSPAAELGAIQQVVERLAIMRADVALTFTADDRPIFHTPGQGHADEAILSIYGREVHRALIPFRYEGERGTIWGRLLPAHLHRASRHGQSLYVNQRWVTNWVLRQAVEEAYRPQVPERRYPWFWIWITLAPADVDPNAHPTKAEVRLAHERQVAALLYRTVRDALIGLSPAVPLASSPAPAQTAAPVAQGTLADTEEGGVFSPKPPAGRPLHQEFLDLVPLGQWQAKYIIAQGPLGLYLIDQHAAHERIYFEEFRRRGEDILTSQTLLVPWTKTLSAAEYAAYAESRDLLARLGFLIDELGGTTITIRALPQGFHDKTPRLDLWQTVIDSLIAESVGEGAHPVSWAEDHRYAMAACKAAIKANRPLDRLEMQHLLTQLAAAGDPRSCPHGRPTLLRLTLEEVDRRFGRRG